MLTCTEVGGQLSLPGKGNQASLATNFAREEALLEGPGKALQLSTHFLCCGQFCRGHLPSQPTVRNSRHVVQCVPLLRVRGGISQWPSASAYCCVSYLKILTPTVFPQKNHLKCLFFPIIFKDPFIGK